MFEGCCSKVKEETTEDFENVELVGPDSYDILSNREYAKAFGLDTNDSSLEFKNTLKEGSDDEDCLSGDVIDEIDVEMVIVDAGTEELDEEEEEEKKQEEDAEDKKEEEVKKKTQRTRRGGSKRRRRRGQRRGGGSKRRRRRGQRRGGGSKRRKHRGQRRRKQKKTTQRTKKRRGSC